MKSPGSLEKRIKDAKAAGYEVHGRYMQQAAADLGDGAVPVTHHPSIGCRMELDAVTSSELAGLVEQVGHCGTSR